MLYKAVQYTLCVGGLTLFLYGVTTLPQPQETRSTTRRPPEEIQNAYSSLVVNSREFSLAMAGLGVFLVGVLSVYLSQPRELPIAAAPAAPAAATPPPPALPPTGVFQDLV